MPIFRQKKDKALSPKQVSPKSTWHEPQQHVDTVVLVHGILGDETGTWGLFPQLLHEDEDLPRIDILCWGYHSGKTPGSYQDVETEGDALLSEIEDLVREGNDIVLVGHSLGGLVILKGVVNRVKNECGRQHPVSSVRWISLYASPLKGSKVADVIHAAIDSNWLTRNVSRVFPNKQLKALRQKGFVEDLLKEADDLIYRPRRESVLIDGPIPVRACYGKQDFLVSKQSAIGPFDREFQPKPLEGGHGECKLPSHHGDTRYLALKRDLERVLTRSFGALCRTVLNDESTEKRREAAARFDSQYGELVVRCAEACFPDRNISDVDKENVVARLWQVGELENVRPSEAITDVVTYYRYRNDPRMTP